MNIQVGDYVTVQGDSEPTIVVKLCGFMGSRLTGGVVVEAYPERTYPDTAITNLSTRNGKLTPYQRGLLHSIKAHAIPLWVYRHLKPAAKRSINCLARKGYVEIISDNGKPIVRFDNSDAVRITEAGRYINTAL